MRWERRLQNHTAPAKTKVRQTSASIDTCTAFATFNVAFFGGRSTSIGADAVTRCVPGGIIAVGMTIIGINVAVWCPFPETAKEEDAEGLRDDPAVPHLIVNSDFFRANKNFALRLRKDDDDDDDNNNNNAKNENKRRYVKMMKANKREKKNLYTKGKTKLIKLKMSSLRIMSKGPSKRLPLLSSDEFKDNQLFH
uniref:Uncharacterized protein n=1 Tax=Glossina austeni TaxID=7395 RepID=A0A1A9URW8_GLOAU